MWKQLNLFGENLELKKGEKPLEGLCTESCYNAEEEVCVCRCHGAYHGLGRLNSRSKHEETKVPSPSAKPRTDCVILQDSPPILSWSVLGRVNGTGPT